MQEEEIHEETTIDFTDLAKSVCWTFIFLHLMPLEFKSESELHGAAEPQSLYSWVRMCSIQITTIVFTGSHS